MQGFLSKSIFCLKEGNFEIIFQMTGDKKTVASRENLCYICAKIFRSIISKEMANDLILVQTALLDKLKEEDTSLSPVLWEEMKNQLVLYEEQECKLPAPVRYKRKMLLSDFVHKVISLPLEINPKLPEETVKQLTRLHLFCAEEAIYDKEVRHNPFMLGFHALQEMKNALMGILISYRLITPSCPYSWNRTFFESHILTYKAADGHTIVEFKLPMPAETLAQALNEEIITDWLIYRSHDHNGIRTLMDIKNNLITIPDYKRGGHPADEFSRFERKMAECRNKKNARKEEALELEFRKTLIRNVADLTAKQMLDEGMSAMDIIEKAFNADLSALALNTKTENKTELKPAENKKIKALATPKKNTAEIESVIAGFLQEDK